MTKITFCQFVYRKDTDQLRHTSNMYMVFIIGSQVPSKLL